MLSRRAFINCVSGFATFPLGTTFAQAKTVVMGGSPNAASSEPPLYALPKDYKKPGDMKWGWGSGKDGILPNWPGGSGTRFNPNFITWNTDNSATLKLDNVNGTWMAGELQVQPKRSISNRWGAALSSERSNAVCALFAYAKDGTEIDFEWRGDQVWQLNLHLFDGSGNRINPSPLPTVAVDISKPHVYEFSMDSKACLWFVDGKEVARIVPADMPGAIWKFDAHFELFVSIEHHGDWAKHSYIDLPSTMKVHGILF